MPGWGALCIGEVEAGTELGAGRGRARLTRAFFWLLCGGKTHADGMIRQAVRVFGGQPWHERGHHPGSGTS